jgi:hypothetical protein
MFSIASILRVDVHTLLWAIVIAVVGLEGLLGLLMMASVLAGRGILLSAVLS